MQPPTCFACSARGSILGRDFIESDALPQPTLPNGQPVPASQQLPAFGIISYEYFQRRLGGNPGDSRQAYRQGGAIIVGVLEPGVELFFRPDRISSRSPTSGSQARLVPGEPRICSALASDRAPSRRRRDRRARQSQADAAAAHSRAITPTYQGADLHFRLEPMQRYLTSQARPAILALMGAAIFLLLIACSNVANLFLVRASLRARDLAVRTAMGASWWRLARQMLAEALLVGGSGSALGFASPGRASAICWPSRPQTFHAATPSRWILPPLPSASRPESAPRCSSPLRRSLRAARPDLAQVLRAAAARADSPAVRSRETSSWFPKSPCASSSWSAPD